LPAPRAFAAAMTRLGVGDNTPVVVYDDARGSIAARLWWMLHILGHEVAVLDGGLDAWTGPRATDDVAPEPASPPFTARAWPADRFVDADAVAELLARDDALLLDARTASRYADGDPAIDPRPGHIPSARSCTMGRQRRSRHRSAADRRRTTRALRRSRRAGRAHDRRLLRLGRDLLPELARAHDRRASTIVSRCIQGRGRSGEPTRHDPRRGVLTTSQPCTATSSACTSRVRG
jgi:rhodanese-related sulfurtransferase